LRRAIVAFAGTGITVTAAPSRLDRTPASVAADFVPEFVNWRAELLSMR
jgi:hypothetical protein